MKLSLVIPTFNERDGLEALVSGIHEVLKPAEIDYELVIVDDNSPDGTWQLAEELGQTYPVRVIRRRGKLGLASAVIDGWTASEGQLLGVMDADGSHDERILPDMVKWLEGPAELAVGSRYIPGGGFGDWPFHRRMISKVAVMMARPICPVRDSTSGFLVFRREILDNVELDPIGFKIGLDLILRGRYTHFVEVPYVFRDRVQGRSKLGNREIWHYLVHLGRLLLFWLQRRPRRKRIRA